METLTDRRGNTVRTLSHLRRGVTPGEVRTDAGLDRDAALLMAVMDGLSIQMFNIRTERCKAPCR